MKKKGYVPQPHTLNTYSENMGGVDKHNWLISKYPISIRGKKWYWPLFIRMIDMVVVNAWVIYKFVNEGRYFEFARFQKKYMCSIFEGFKCQAINGKEA